MYAFFVAPKANRIEIGKAVEEAFKVKVTDVNVVTVKPRRRVRQGRIYRSAGLRDSSSTSGGFFNRKVEVGARRITRSRE